jgi:GNAT superfamily N-acetyltransferase
MWGGMNSSTAINELVVQSGKQALADTASLIENTEFGSDGLAYKRLNVQAQLNRFNDPTYFHASLDGELVGCYVLDRRDLIIKGKQIKGYYRGVLAVTRHMQGRGIGKQLTESAGRWLQEQAGDSPLLSFGCIDQSNKRSLHVLKSAGAMPGPSLSMYMMYRQWPALRCELVTEDAANARHCAELADEVYADCQIRDVSKSRLPLLLLRDKRGIAVSARIAETAFHITNMAALGRWSTRLFVTPFAAARKRFNPEHFRYVSFSDVYIRVGCESLWHDFVSSVLARHNCHSGAIFVDPRSRLYRQLQKANYLTRFIHSNKGSIRVLTQVFNDNGELQNSLDDEQAAVHLWPIDA